jgi:hypothetical protein
MRLVRIEGGVNSAKYHVGAAFPGHFSYFVTAKRIRRMNTNADDVSRFDAQWIEGFQSFVN